MFSSRLGFSADSNERGVLVKDVQGHFYFSAFFFLKLGLANKRKISIMLEKEYSTLVSATVKIVVCTVHLDPNK